MKKTSNKNAKQRTARTVKPLSETELDSPVPQKVGITTYLEPTEYDLHDELSRLDSFTYAKYTN